MKVLLTGVNGLVGKDAARVFMQEEDFDLYGIGRAECMQNGLKYKKMDLLDFESLKRYLDDLKPDLIVHFAAYTKLDDCERNREYAYKINVEATGVLACNTPRFVYMSSDAVFDGMRGNYTEEDETNPINYYGYTKLMGEEEAKKCDNTLILRSSIFGFNQNENKSIAEWGIENLLKNNEIKGFSDVIFNPLYSDRLVRIIMNLVKSNQCGLYHLGSRNVVSKYEFFQIIAKQLGKDKHLVIPASVKSVDFLANRTQNTSLATKKIEEILPIENNLELQICNLVEDMEYYQRLII